MTVELRPVTRHIIDALIALDAGDGGKQVAGNAKCQTRTRGAWFAEGCARRLVGRTAGNAA